MGEAVGSNETRIPGETSEHEDGADGFVEVGAAADLPDGQMSGIEIGGERVLVANMGGEFYAIGAICTHERANLDEGSLFEGAVYCPLHYSAFDVRSGQVLGPPAERSTPTYAVKVENGKILVSARPSAEGTATTTSNGHAEESVRYEQLQQARPWYDRMSQGIDSLGWLRRLTESVMAVLTAARKRLLPTGLLDLMHGRWFGHALHPVLSDLPIGLWASALLLYLIGQPQPAAVLGAVGVASALAAAATGVVDLSVAEGHERRAGVLHGLLMTCALAIQVGSTVAYLAADSYGVAVALSGTGFIVTVVGAYLGGHLVFGRGTMVNHTSWPPGPVLWVRTVSEAELDEAPGRSRVVRAGDTTVLLHRNRDGRISAIHSACSHAGAGLSVASGCDAVATCPWHGSEFSLRDGGVIRGPAIYPQPAFEVRVRDGWVEIRSPE